MKTTIDLAGRLIIPAAIRRAAHLDPGAELDVRVEDGCIVLEALPMPVRAVREGRFTIAVPKGASPPPLSAAEVEEIRDEMVVPLRSGRARP